MKKIAITFQIIFFTFSAAIAQDVITKNNGETIEAIVNEISGTEIKYKRFDNPNGPFYYMPKNDVFIIKYQNGIIEKIGNGQNNQPIQYNINKGVHPAQPQGESPLIRPINLSGPRIGATYLTPGRALNRLRDNFDDVVPVFSLFGWQFETQFFTLDDGTTGVFEFVPMIAGLEQGLFLPTASGLIGIRNAKGYEIGVGPNLSLSGAGLVFAAGINFQSSQINFPVNFVVVTSPAGVRYSLVFGFNIRTK
jgi:hypothetical protein